jgi:hypothetical protein
MHVPAYFAEAVWLAAAFVFLHEVALGLIREAFMQVQGVHTGCVLFRSWQLLHWYEHALILFVYG